MFSLFFTVGDEACHLKLLFYFVFLQVIKVKVYLYGLNIISTAEINCLTYFMRFSSQWLSL